MSYRSKSSIQRTYARKSILFWHSQWDGINRVVTSTFAVSTDFSKIHWPRQGRFRPLRQHRHTKPHVTSVPIYAPLSVSAVTGVRDSSTRGGLLRSEVAGNVQNQVGQVRRVLRVHWIGIGVNLAACASGHDRHVRGD